MSVNNNPDESKGVEGKETKEIEDKENKEIKWKGIPEFEPIKDTEHTDGDGKRRKRFYRPKYKTFILSNAVSTSSISNAVFGS